MRGRLRITLTDPNQPECVLAERRARNTVMASGAALIAQLFAGQGTPITHMGVGTSDADPDLTATTALSNEAVGDAAPLEGDTTTRISADAFSFETDDTARRIRVRVRATLPDTAAVGTIREAGLLSQPEGGDAVLYNRVTFAPVAKGDDHELTMFWEVEFPFGDLQWIS